MSTATTLASPVKVILPFTAASFLSAALARSLPTMDTSRISEATTTGTSLSTSTGRSILSTSTPSMDFFTSTFSFWIFSLWIFSFISGTAESTAVSFFSSGLFSSCGAASITAGTSAFFSGSASGADSCALCGSAAFAALAFSSSCSALGGSCFWFSPASSAWFSALSAGAFVTASIKAVSASACSGRPEATISAHSTAAIFLLI